MKVAINILKVIEIIITSIWGLLLGIFGPIVLMSGDVAPEFIANHYILKVWLISSALFYLTGTLIVVLQHYKVALCFHTAGLISSIYIYGVFQSLAEINDAANPAMLYMPLIFLTLFTLVITIIANYKKINEKLEKVKEKEYEAAPSLLGGEYKLDPKKEKGGKK